jgi:predicted DNA-binding protein with PD1-like motif
MKHTEANLGRIFILRMEHGDRIPDTMEEFAKNNHIESAMVIFLGGADKGSKVVVGPEENTTGEVIKMVATLHGISEAAGVGTIFVNQEGISKLHLHSAFGRNRDTITGCTRDGVNVWLIGEAIIFELINHTAKRKIDPQSGFELLDV